MRRTTLRYCPPVRQTHPYTTPDVLRALVNAS
jgi:hypothetical protein